MKYKDPYLIEGTVVFHCSPGHIKLSVGHDLEVISFVNDFLEVHSNTTTLYVRMRVRVMNQNAQFLGPV